MTLVLHLALPEELTLPLVVLLAAVVVLDLKIPLGPLLYFVSFLIAQEKDAVQKFFYSDIHVTSQVDISQPWLPGSHPGHLPPLRAAANHWNPHPRPPHCSPHCQVVSSSLSWFISLSPPAHWLDLLYVFSIWLSLRPLPEFTASVLSIFISMCLLWYT